MNDVALAEKKDADRVNRKTFQTLLGSNVRRIREEKKWTREFLAQEAQINDKYVYDIEKGKKCISAWVLVKLAKALDVGYDRLLADDDLTSSNGF